MTKRRRRPEKIPERFFYKRRRRQSLSPSMEPKTDSEYTRQLFNFQIEIDLLKAQMRLLQREINQLREQESSGHAEKQVNGRCSIM